jgi:hypothetical protein
MVSVLCFVGAAAATIALVHAAERQAREQRSFEDPGADAEAVVTRLWRSSGKNRPRWVAYRFSVDGRVFSGQSRAPRRFWERLRVGSPLRVRYVTADPGRNVPHGLERSPLPWFSGPIAGVALTLAGLLAMMPIRKQRWLLSEGRACPGVVVRHTKRSHGTTIHYEFVLLSGATARGSSSPARKPTALDSPLCIVCDPDDPRRHAIYPLQLVKLA